MIDYFFQFANEAAAIANASGSIYYTVASSSSSSGFPRAGGWNQDRVVPGLQIWRASQDVANPSSLGGGFTHTMLPGWYGCISIPSVDNTLVNHANLQIAIDRDLSAAGGTAILRSNVSSGVLQDLRFQPVFAGSNYPFGNLK